MSTRCFVLACCLLAARPLSAQDRPGASGASSSHSTSHRVVVVDGKTVVDELKVDGKTVDSGKDPAHGLPQEWQDLLDRVRRGAEIGAGKAAGNGAQASSSHTRRVVVENGRVVVDEETRDGRPVRHGGDGQQPGAARADAHADASAESHASSSSEHSESSDSSHGESSRSDRRSDKKDASTGNEDARQRDGAREQKAKPAPAEPAPKAGKPAPSANDRNV